MIPTFILQMWFFGLVSLGFFGGVIWLVHEWQQRSWVWHPGLQESYFAPDFGANAPTALLLGAVLLAVVVVWGGDLLRVILRLISRGHSKELDPRMSLRPVFREVLLRPDGSKLNVESYGPADGIPIILTHGWGLHGAEWNYAKRELSDRFRLIVWDEPGLGKSTRPSNGDFSLENLAKDLDAVLRWAGDKPAILLGHSIGGMITLTFCRMFPEALSRRVLGLVLTHTTPMNPVRTTAGAAFFTAIEKPVLIPLMYLTIALSPLVWIMNWLSYRNGTAHLSTKRSSFAGTESWAQVEFATGFQPIAPPAVLARGMLGMMNYDAREALGRITVPTLVVAGDKDSTTKPEASEMIREGIPGARLVTLAPAKHLGLVEHHAVYAKEVREFIYASAAAAVSPKTEKRREKPSQVKR